MQLGGAADLLQQPLAQQIGEQVVVAIPAPLGIQRHHEQVGALELVEQNLAG